ncbi:MAG: pyridoxamine 5-phosphate oxidase family protein [Mycobacterium sp.]|jgi:pyridoxamine 5'-phosphate oxidase family protein|nr:pyridoxamine 5-phosphate oxidase family protein [Mycobacterium sp.]MDT5231186.1 pyridoxamine 5-phosphate oxidase family protein [Mycobacterium sp.]
MSFKPHEIEFMKAAELARLATIQPDGTLQNNPVGFTVNEDLGTIDIFGYRMSKSRKFRNVASKNTVALVIDDIVSRNPWRVRCLEIRGTAEQAESGERRTEPNADEIDTAIIRITPRRIISFGIGDTETEPHKLATDSRDVPTTAD